MSKERTVIGQNIKKYREARGMTQLVLAKAAHLSPATIGHMEIGDVPNPKILTLKKIADALDIKVDELIASSQKN